MAMDKSGRRLSLTANEEASHNHNYKRDLVKVFGATVLCVFFYILGVLQNSSVVNTAAMRLALSLSPCPMLPPSHTQTHLFVDFNVSLDFNMHHQGVDPEGMGMGVDMFKACNIKYSEYTPCHDEERSKVFGNQMMMLRERHCPHKEELLRCRIPYPPGYRTPFRWPQSRDFAWYANVPHKQLTVIKADQNWIKFEGDRFRFPGGGTSFPNGAQAYIRDIAKLIPLAGGSIRTALDTGCGQLMPFVPVPKYGYWCVSGARHFRLVHTPKQHGLLHSHLHIPET